jgi:hypothetical protein
MHSERLYFFVGIEKESPQYFGNFKPKNNL